MAQGEKPISHLIDVNTPSVARIYDWLLGGIENFRSDRDAGEELLRIAPSTKTLALNNRAFLRRVVRELADTYNIQQFLDHGSGLPTQDNVHEVAQRAAGGARTVYIDNDPIVGAHGRTRLAQDDQTAMVHADMRDTDRIFEHAAVRRLINPGEPVAALFVSVMHCLKDDDVQPMLQRVTERLAPGSFLVICQLVSDRRDVRNEVTRLMNDITHDNWGRVREEHEVTAYFDGLEIIPPGLGDVVRWRPDTEVVPRPHIKDWVEWGGVGRLS
ncbi:SAM-dependent methyltransferase [Streptomyces sp. AK02-01A]|uniref:SAM-dependent methyltransferase n=1 Tax=Streptomyces sp. AK02-01A TaxID=3028648 RepID=UPI0029BCBBD3|nr:SAM-dependent methyltransferase [Streptomyces sp. AK02-01A]MDX3855924.1 SAM-dependent methyltransferase [Streptomyces sp. AK02-01A]